MAFVALLKLICPKLACAKVLSAQVVNATLWYGMPVKFRARRDYTKKKFLREEGSVSILEGIEEVEPAENHLNTIEFSWARW